MVKKIESMLLSSANPTRLAKFYESIGVKISQEWEMGDNGESAYEMKLPSGSGFYINPHSKVNGRTKEPYRLMLNFEVDDIKSAVKKLKSQDVRTVADVYHMQEYGWIATFADPDGNYFQLVQVRAK